MMYDAARTGRVKLKKSLQPIQSTGGSFSSFAVQVPVRLTPECRFVWCQLIAFCVTFFRLVT